MILNALIAEQLEADGTIRSFRMEPPAGSEHLIVAYADEYDEPLDGPLHFHDPEHAKAFAEGFAQCRIRRLGASAFQKVGDAYHFETGWSGVPIKRNALSYYALSLPRFAIPKKLSLTNPRKPGREYQRKVIRDDRQQRYIVYLECNSDRDSFDFQLACDFVVDPNAFAASEFNDTIDPASSEGNLIYGADQFNGWIHQLPESESSKVNQFFFGEVDTAYREHNLHPNEERRQPRDEEHETLEQPRDHHDFHPTAFFTLLGALLVFLALVLWQLPRISSYDLGAPTFVVILTAALLSAVLLFGVLRSSGVVRGRRWGFYVELGGGRRLGCRGPGYRPEL